LGFSLFGQLLVGSQGLDKQFLAFGSTLETFLLMDAKNYINS